MSTFAAAAAVGVVDALSSQIQSQRHQNVNNQKDGGREDGIGTARVWAGANRQRQTVSAWGMPERDERTHERAMSSDDSLGEIEMPCVDDACGGGVLAGAD